MRNYVLDSYAVLAYFQDESGAAEVGRRLVGGAVVTGDPEFEKAEKLVPVFWLPRKDMRLP